MRVRLLSFLIFLLALSLTHATAASPFLADGPTNLAADVAVETAQVTWQPRSAFEQVLLTVTGPEGVQIKRAFEPGENIALAYNADLLPDGDYTYEMTLLAPATEAQIAEAGLTDQLEEARLSGEESRALRRLVQEGAFSVAAGQMLRQETASSNLLFDKVTNDDCIVIGSICVGFDCTNGYSFGFNTIVLRENNLRIFFEDTSNSASFPTNDWILQANATTNGGSNHFAIVDEDAGRPILKMEAGAPSNSLYIDDGGRIGLGTATPVVELHIVDGDTPTLRLEQDGSSGFTPQTWDVAGNETNFFVRDVTNGSNLPLRIRPNAPSNSIFVNTDGAVGMGTSSPATSAKLHVKTGVGADGFIRLESGGPQIQLLDNDGTRGIRMFGNGGAIRLGYSNDTGGSWTNVFEIAFNAPADAWVMDNGGNVTIANNLTVNGTFSNPSSIHLKENFAPVNAQQVLTKLSQIPVSTWTYINDEDGRLHMGPMAQDFWAAFGLGIGEEYLSPLDVNGVALAAIQALNEQVQAERDRAEALAQQNAALAARMMLLEQKVEALMTTQH